MKYHSCSKFALSPVRLNVKKTYYSIDIWSLNEICRTTVIHITLWQASPKTFNKANIVQAFFQQHFECDQCPCLTWKWKKKFLDIAYLFISQTIIRAVPDCRWNNFSSLKSIEGRAEKNLRKKSQHCKYIRENKWLPMVIKINAKSSFW